MREAGVGFTAVGVRRKRFAGREEEDEEEDEEDMSLSEDDDESSPRADGSSSRSGFAEARGVS